MYGLWRYVFVKPILFLDIDGVLNCGSTKDAAPSGALGVEDRKVEILANIVEKWNADIVLTSTWQKDWNPDINMCAEDGVYLSRKLAEYGLSIRDKIGDSYVARRGEGIRNWLEGHGNPKNFIVIDDSEFDFRQYKILPHFIKTSYKSNGGLTYRHEKLADKLFTKFSEKERLLPDIDVPIFGGEQFSR